MNKRKCPAVFLAVLLQLAIVPQQKAYAYSNPAAVPLLTVSDFAALAHTSITSLTGPTVLNNDGNLGVDAGACTNFLSPCTGTVNGTLNSGAIHLNDGVALQGQTDATAAVTNIGLRVSDTTVAGGVLDNLTLTEGVYTVPHAVTANLTGDLTLTGDADSVFIFHLTSDLVTAGTSHVILSGGVQACHVFWKVDSSATFDGATRFAGTVLAQTSVFFTGGGATLDGRVVAQTAAITFLNTTVNTSSCSSGSGGSNSNRSSNTFNEDTRCLATTPSDPQWVLKSPATDGVNLSWSAMGGSLVDIQIANGNGEFVYKYEKVANNGHMFLPNVAMSQAVRVRVLNDCEYGEWLVASAGPGLPNTGFAPAQNNVADFISSGIFKLQSLFLKLVR